MTKQETRHYKCVIGDILSLPNQINYLQAISSRKKGVWIGHCKGDKLHPEHLIVIKKAKKYYLLNNVTDTFKKPDGKILGNRLFKRFDSKEPEKFVYPQLRCPIGKVYMHIQKFDTRALNMPNVDIYRCTGNRHGSGHREHFVRIHHGSLEVEINKKMIGVLIITIESD